MDSEQEAPSRIRPVSLRVIVLAALVQLVAFALVLVLTACSNSQRSPNELAPGMVEDVQSLEVGDPAAPEDAPQDDRQPEYADRLIVRLKDGRTVYLVYNGPRHFEPGQPVRVHITDTGIFLL